MYKNTVSVFAFCFTLCFLFVNNTFADIYNREFLTPKEITEAKQNEIDHQKRRKYPNVKIAFIQEFLVDNLVRDQNNSASANTRMYQHSKGFFNFGLTRNIFLNSTLSIEPVSNQYNNPYGVVDYADNNYSIKSFDRNGLIAEELNISYKNEKVQIMLGKFNPIFAAGAQRYSKIFDNDWYGISGTSTNMGYQLREKLGARLDFIFLDDREVVFTGFSRYNKSQYLNHDDEDDDDENEDNTLFHQYLRLSMSTYKNDNTALFNSAISPKNDIYYNNSVGMDSRFRSYSIALDGYLRSAFSKTVLNISNRAAYNNDSKMSNESANAIAGEHVFYLPGKVKFGSFGEYVAVKNFAGIGNANQKYTTVAAFMGFSGISVNYVMNRFISDGIANINNVYFANGNIVYQPFLSDRYTAREFSIGYEFENGIAIKLGRKRYSDISRGSKTLNNLDADQISVRYRINY